MNNRETAWSKLDVTQFSIARSVPVHSIPGVDFFNSRMHAWTAAAMES